jgi:hypothetical protein
MVRVLRANPRSQNRGLAQTLFSNVCDLPKARFAEGCHETLRPPRCREIADSKLRSLRQPRGNGGTVRLVMLPFESHGYRAMETTEHVLYEMLAWFDRYVKNAPPRTR